jgi:hypothetical protein
MRDTIVLAALLVAVLPPGTHTLQLLLGDMNHVPHNPPVLSKKITFTFR